MAENIGGFYASLKLQTDEASFQRGLAGLKSTGSELASLVGWAAKIAGLAVTIKGLYEGAAKGAQNLLTASYINMSANAIDKWSGAIKEAGGNAASFVDSISEMNKKMFGMMQEGFNPGNQLLIDLGRLGLSATAVAGMNSDERTLAIMKAAAGKGRLGQDILQRIMGPDALQMLLYSQSPYGRSISEMLRASTKRGITDDALRAGGGEGVTQVRILGDSVSRLVEALGSQFFKNIAPTIKSLNEWLAAHQQDIKDLVKKLGDFSVAITSFLASTVVLGLTEMLATIGGHPEMAQDLAQKYSPQWMRTVANKKMDFMDTIKDLPSDVRDRMLHWLGGNAAAAENWLQSLHPKINWFSWPPVSMDAPSAGISLPPTGSPLKITVDVNVVGLPSGMSAAAKATVAP